MSEGSHFETSYHNESINKDSHLKTPNVCNESLAKEEEIEPVILCSDLGGIDDVNDTARSIPGCERVAKDSVNSLNDGELLNKDGEIVRPNSDSVVISDVASTDIEVLRNCDVPELVYSQSVNNNNDDENSDSYHFPLNDSSYTDLFERYIKRVPTVDAAGQKKDSAAALAAIEMPTDSYNADFVREEPVYPDDSSPVVEIAQRCFVPKVEEVEAESEDLLGKPSSGHDRLFNGEVLFPKANVDNKTEIEDNNISDINTCDDIDGNKEEDIIYYLKVRKTAKEEIVDNDVISSAKIRLETTSVETDLEIKTKNNKNILNKNKMFALHRSESIPNINENDSNDNEPLLSKRDNNFRPIYRLSMRLSQTVFGNIDIPNADTHRQYDKAGYLLKLSGRGFPYLHQWKRRYCVLTKSAMYVYEKENSRGCDKNSFIIDLKYFDHVAEAMQKESKKASNVFVVTSQDRSFFDPGRHLFSADTLTEMHEWISKLKEAVELIRNNNRPTSKISHSKHAEEKTLKEIRQSLNESFKDRRRSREIADAESNQHISERRDTDVVDSKAKIEEELKASLEKKRKRESTDRKSKAGLEKSETVDKDDVKGEEEEVDIKLPRKRSSTKKIVLQNPSNVEAESKPLESITKHRNKGPSGRRAPQNRRTVLMKQRASSMSALQHGMSNDDSAREDNWVNVSADVLEEDGSRQDPGSLNTSHPALAYRYSSDEDSFSDDAKDPEDYFNPSRPISASYNIPEVLHKPVEGLRVYVHQLERRRTDERGGSPPLQSNGQNQDLLEYRSLPRQSRKSASGVGHSPLTKLPSLGRGSASKLSSGRASPEMDALDNLLMSQSVRPSGALVDVSSDHEGSDVSTCKGTQCEAEVGNKELSNVFQGFSDSLQHLQHHTAELELRTKVIESDVGASRKEITKLLESSRNLQSDVEQLAKAVSIITEETSSARKQIISQRKENEQVQRVASSVLSDAKRAQAEYELAKSNYESLIKELHALVTSIRTSLIVTEREDEPQQALPQTISEPEIKREDKSKPESKENESGKRTPNKDYSKMSGYQSFFQRPSSLIYGLTYRTAGKPSSNADKNKLRKEEKESNKKDLDEKRNKSSEGSLEKKHRKEKSAQNSLEKKSKSGKRGVAQIEQDGESGFKESKVKETQNFHKIGNDAKATSKKLSKLSFENIPMMDDHADNIDNRDPKVSVGISHVTINVSPPSHNYQVEKSMSSPTVIVKGLSSKKSHPNSLSISQSSKDHLTPQSSPDSSPSGPAPGIFGSDKPVFTAAKEFRSQTETSLFPISPPSSGSNRPSFRANVLDERSTAQMRPGTFAISRQSSYPNIPVQRQNSLTLFPLQRQHSLGTVPEEGQLPRQASLRSVPEDRPIVDQTLPLSPSPSMVSFSLSPSPSAGGLDALRERNSIRNSMELVTGPVISGSQIQESYIRQLPSPTEFQQAGELPVATSSLKRTNERKKKSRVVHV